MEFKFRSWIDFVKILHGRGCFWINRVKVLGLGLISKINVALGGLFCQVIEVERELGLFVSVSCFDRVKGKQNDTSRWTMGGKKGTRQRMVVTIDSSWGGGETVISSESLTTSCLSSVARRFDGENNKIKGEAGGNRGGIRECEGSHSVDRFAKRSSAGSVRPKQRRCEEAAKFRSFPFGCEVRRRKGNRWLTDSKEEEGVGLRRFQAFCSSSFSFFFDRNQQKEVVFGFDVW